MVPAGNDRNGRSGDGSDIQKHRPRGDGAKASMPRLDIGEEPAEDMKGSGKRKDFQEAGSER